MKLSISNIMKMMVVGGIYIATISVVFGQDKKEEEDPRLGVSTDFGDVLVENLGIGRTYNLRELAGTPYKVSNKSTETVDLKIDVTIPAPNMISRKRKNMGVQPIPSLSWVTVGQDEFILPPGETALTDIIFEIPNDPSLYGKWFQTSIHSRTTGRDFLQLGVWSHFIFSIVQSPEAQAKQEENRKKGLLQRQTAEFTLLPDKIYVPNVPIGRKFDIRKENKKTIKLANSGENPVDLIVETIQVADSPVTVQTGFEAGPAGWLKSKSTEFHLDVDSVVDPKWTLELPNDPSLSKKKLMFVFRAKPKGEDVVGFTFYGRFYVEVE